MRAPGRPGARFGLKGAKPARAPKRHTFPVSRRVLLRPARRDLDASAVSNYSRGEMIREAHWPWRTASSTRRQHHRARARARDAWPQLVPARVARAPSAALAASFPNRLVSRQCRNASARVTVEPASRRARRRGGPSPTEPRSSSRGRAFPRHSRRRKARSARPRATDPPARRGRRAPPDGFSGTPSKRRSASGSSSASASAFP